MKRVIDPDNVNMVKISEDGTKVSSEGLEWKPNPFDEYSSLSQRGDIVRKRLCEEKTFRDEFDGHNALIEAVLKPQRE